MTEKPKAMYGEVQGVVGYWYPEMDMDMWLKLILEKAELVDILENEITRRQEDTRLVLKLEKCLEAVKTWLTYAKAQGYISISQGEKLDDILEGVDEKGEK